MAAEAPPTKPKDVELSDQGGEKHEDGFHAKEEKKAELPDFFPSHGLTTAGDYSVHIVSVSSCAGARS